MSRTDRSMHERLRAIPSVQSILEHRGLCTQRETLGQTRVVRAVRAEIDGVRTQVLAGNIGPIDAEVLVAGVQIRLKNSGPGLREVINATGILLHTGLGRAPIASAALEAAMAAARGYTNLEFDLASGERGRRTTFIESLLTELTGAEGATVVNNNAAATVLTLRALARDAEVIVSRGELIEIGGSYRLPEIFEASGARLREVGTTNKTRLADYERAIGPTTRAIMRVHSSNYRIMGFTESTPLIDLAQLAHSRGLWLIDDIGSGMLGPGLLPEVIDDPTVSAGIAAGADLVLFSGDKLLGGPQCGIIVGKRELVSRVESDPLMRAFRVDKLVLAALEATLQLIVDGDGPKSIPLWAMLNAPMSQIHQRAERLSERLRNEHAMHAMCVASESYLGGGSLPAQAMPSFAVRVFGPYPQGQSAQEWTRALRLGSPSVVPRIHADSVWFDLRSVPETSDLALADALCRPK